MPRPISVLSLLVVALAGPSLADKPKLVVVPFGTGKGASESASAKFYGLVVDDLRTRGEVVELVNAPSAPPTAPPPAAEKPADKGPVKRDVPSAEAVNALQAGQTAFDELRFEDAVTHLKKGIDGMLASPASADYPAVAEAYVKLAASAFRMGEEKIAKAALLDLARFSPTYALPTDFPPIFHREFEKAKKRLEKQPRGTVSIEGPPGATAYLDGLDLGMVPVQEENVLNGVHFVKVEGTGGEKFGQTIQVGNGAVKVKATFGGTGERAPPPVAATKAPKGKSTEFTMPSQIDKGLQDRLAAYAKGVSAEWALVGYISKSSETQLTIEAALFSVKKGTFALLTPVAFDTDVLTANTEAFKFGDEVTKRLEKFEPLNALPLNLATRAMTVTAQVGPNAAATNPDDLEMAGPKRRKPVLLPQGSRAAEVSPAFDTTATEPSEAPKAQGGGVPTWVWVVTGVAVAAGAGVGGYFGISALTKPVTGTVTATW